ncbi:MAG: DegT/DnrJ/EryC1/StrS family aminotransferase [Gaiellaceae bacterium]
MSRFEPVGFVALERQHASVAAELRAAFDRVLGASAFILGREVAQFEAEFATFCGASHCIGVGSGTAALRLALRAAGIGAGDEVIVAAHGFVASALAVVHAGATPVFCDVEWDTGLIDVGSAAGALSARTAAIMPVHLYGQVCDMDAVSTLAARRGLFVLEDAAQAHGAAWRGRRAGSLGDAAAFSFYPSKNLGALGDGGAIVTDDDGFADRARELRDLGRRPTGEFAGGYNDRLDGLQAAMLRVKLPRVDAWNATRREHARRYAEELGEVTLTLTERAASPCVYHLFPIRLAGRDDLARHLAGCGIATGLHYSPTIDRQPAFAERPEGGVDLSAAERWAREELSLPISPELRTDERARVVAATLELLEGMSASVREVEEAHA